MALSPRIAADMQHTLLFAAEKFEEEQQKHAARHQINHIEPVYICPECGKHHDWEDDAIDCCAPDVQEGATLEESLRTTCPVCGHKHDDTHEAAHCCLWHDTTWLQRFLIANRVEAGATWPDAIEAVTGQPITTSH